MIALSDPVTLMACMAVVNQPLQMLERMVEGEIERGESDDWSVASDLPRNLGPRLPYESEGSMRRIRVHGRAL
jgi:hypothetical protein